MREQPMVSQEVLRTCLQDQYDLIPVTLEFLPRGQDYSAGVYRVMSEQGNAYLLKLKAGPFYEPGCLVPGYLNGQGVTAVVAPIPTNSNTLWTKLGAWTVIVYLFIDGDTSLTGMTNEQWKVVGNTCKRIHELRLVPESFEALRRETFDPTAYAQWVHAFETQYLPVQHTGSDSERALRAAWMAHQATIHTAVTSLEKLATVLQTRTFPYVICHADLHPANLLRDQAGHVFVIDWDDVMLAPKERDFIFVQKLHADAFWDGYGPSEIDWPALTYFLWERVVQDLIEYAGHVRFRDDLGEETKANAVQRFHVNLAEDGNMIAAAYAAAAHFPRDLTVRTK